PVSCPSSNLSTVIVGGRQYLITCGIDYFDNDISSPLSPTFPKSYEGCLADCSSTPSCAAVAYVKGGPCYLKTGTGTGFKIDSTVIGAKLVRVLPTSTSATSTPSGPTVTVTTTISNTGYQCACTPTSFPTPTPVTCPADNGSTYTTTCGAKYAVECAQDRYGNDIPNGLFFVDSYESCLEKCDQMSGCVAISFVPRPPGVHSPCYTKYSTGTIRPNPEVNGSSKISGCTRLKLRRKRVKQLDKRVLFLGPDFTFTQSQVTATQTSTVGATVLITSTPLYATSTAFRPTLATAIATSTVTVRSTVVNTVSYCPAAT
ncbi:hypothetical protein J3E74DRAFT_181371, partial [Bipolaris maydis]